MLVCKGADYNLMGGLHARIYSLTKLNSCKSIEFLLSNHKVLIEALYNSK